MDSPRTASSDVYAWKGRDGIVSEWLTIEQISQIARTDKFSPSTQVQRFGGPWVAAEEIPFLRDIVYGVESPCDPKIASQKTRDLAPGLRECEGDQNANPALFRWSLFFFFFNFGVYASRPIHGDRLGGLLLIDTIFVLVFGFHLLRHRIGLSNFVSGFFRYLARPLNLVAFLGMLLLAGNRLAMDLAVPPGSSSPSKNRRDVLRGSLFGDDDTIVEPRVAKSGLKATDTPELIPDWELVSIPKCCQFQIPPTMEMQAGAYKRYSETLQRLVLEAKSEKRVVAQQKGLNRLRPEAREVYARVIVETDSAEKGEYVKLNTPLGLSSSDLRSIDRELQEGIKNLGLTAPFKSELLSWQQAKVATLAGVPCVTYGYSRTAAIKGKRPVTARVYLVFNYDCLHTITVSYREDESELWATDLDRVLGSFKFIDRYKEATR